MDTPSDPDRDTPDGDRSRPPPARGRGPERDLSDRAAAFVDRAADLERSERFERRRREVARIRRTRRRRGLLVLAAAVSSVVGISVALGAVLGGSRGALIGLGGAVLTGLIVLGVRGLARQRGASAWDWTTQSHRLLGDPSQRVRPGDRDEDRSGPQRAWRRD